MFHPTSRPGALRRLVLGLALTLALPVSAVAREPLKISDESPLDQRVLTRPEAILRDAPDANAVKKPPVFSTYYVFARETRDGTEWLELGANRTLRDAQGRSALDWARASGHAEVVAMLTS